MSGSFFHPHLSGRWRKAAGQPASEASRPVIVSVVPQVSVSQITTRRCTFVEEVAAIAAAGLDGIGLWRPKVSAYRDDAVAAVLNEFGVKPASLSWAGGFTGSLGHTYQEAFDDARAAIQQAALWGVENLVIVAGSRNGHALGHCWKTVKGALLMLADEAGSKGVRLAVLPAHPRFSAETTFLNGLDDTLALLDDMKHPYAGLAFDTFSLCQSAAAADRIPSLAAKTCLVQISDSSSDETHQLDCLPGTGILPVADIVQRFLASGYQGMFDVQVWSPDVWRLPASEVIAACRRFANSVPQAVLRFS